MQVSALQPKIDASHVALESLNDALFCETSPGPVKYAAKLLGRSDGSLRLPMVEIGEASRQFEAILLRQFLAESQKPMIKSEFTDDSNTAGIYQDMVTNQLADSLSRGGGIGLAKTFERQLTPHTAHHSLAANPQTNHPAGQVSKTDALLISKPAGHGQTGPHRGPNPFSHT